MYTPSRWLSGNQEIPLFNYFILKKKLETDVIMLFSFLESWKKEKKFYVSDIEDKKKKKKDRK